MVKSAVQRAEYMYRHIQYIRMIALANQFCNNVEFFQRTFKASDYKVLKSTLFSESVKIVDVSFYIPANVSTLLSCCRHHFIFLRVLGLKFRPICYIYKTE